MYFCLKFYIRLLNQYLLKQMLVAFVWFIEC